MFRRFFVASLASAALFALVTQEASAWGTGGGLPTCCKTAPLYDLYCDLNEDVQGIPGLETDQFQILSTPSNASPDDDPTLIVGGTPANPGATQCVEVPHDSCGGPGQPECSLASAAPGFPVGVFLWQQETDPSFPDGGLNYSEDPDCSVDGDCTRQWSVVAERDATLLFTVRLSLAEGPSGPVNSDAVIQAYCSDFVGDPPYVRTDGDFINAVTNLCVASIGYPEDTRNFRELLQRFPAGESINSDFGDGATWDEGEAIRFATQTASDEEVPIGFDFRAYNSTAFDSQLPVVSFYQGDDTQPTLSDADIIATVPLETKTQPNINVNNTSPSANLPFAVVGCTDLTFDPDTGAPIDTSSAPHFCGASGPCFKVNGQVVRYSGFTVSDTEVSATGCDVPPGGLAAADDLNLQVDRDDFISAITPCTDGPATIRMRFPLVDENGDSSDRLGESEEIVNLTNCGSQEAPTLSGAVPTQPDDAVDGEEIASSDLGVSGLFTGADLTYSANGMPCGLSIDPNTGVFSTIGCDSSPGLGFAASQGGNNGVYTIQVCAENRGGTECSPDSIMWTVANVDPETDGVIPDQSNKRGDRLNGGAALDVSGFFSDGAPDGDELTFSATGLPNGLSISSDGTISGRISNNPSVVDTYSVEVTADDGQGGSVASGFTWTVTN